ncbi:MAG TPA: SAM-dependent methyltransferase [Casimicrobiaceae bacterium]|nr:SAM-dependent methyltransferase [Casimicrobiaceae bacterium]
MSAAPPDGRGAPLPSPSPAALAHGARVIEHVAGVIARAGGWISFADYMGEVLYAPGLGYYAAGAQKFGAAGDFVTAPESTSLFGRALASQLAQVQREVPAGEILELGPGSGRLAADLLITLADRGAAPARYRLLEVSADLRERQRELLASTVSGLLPRVEWIDALPGRWQGAIVANEVLDAVPPHLVHRRRDAWFERGVGLDPGGRFALVDRPLAAGLLRDAALARFPAEGDYLSEINPAAEALVLTLAQRCERGVMLIIDYGFPAPEYYHPQRSSGTLIAHYRHHALADPLVLPGLADLAAHVDFTAIAHAGVAGGMRVAGYATQARFLINCGLLDELQRCGDPRSTRYLREASAVQKLTSPAEMGELFKVLAFARGFEPELVGFREGDRSHRL